MADRQKRLRPLRRAASASGGKVAGLAAHEVIRISEFRFLVTSSPVQSTISRYSPAVAPWLFTVKNCVCGGVKVSVVGDTVGGVPVKSFSLILMLAVHVTCPENPWLRQNGHPEIGRLRLVDLHVFRRHESP